MTPANRRIHLWLTLVVALLMLLLVCGTGVGFVYTGIAVPPEFTIALGPMAISGGHAVDTSCPEPWVRCELSHQELDQRAFYAIWFVYRAGAQASQYGHLSLHLPIRR